LLSASCITTRRTFLSEVIAQMVQEQRLQGHLLTDAGFPE
jgi:hypothetical protein